MSCIDAEISEESNILLFACILTRLRQAIITSINNSAISSIIYNVGISYHQRLSIDLLSSLAKSHRGCCWNCYDDIFARKLARLAWNGQWRYCLIGGSNWREWLAFGQSDFSSSRRNRREHKIACGVTLRRQRPLMQRVVAPYVSSDKIIQARASSPK